MKSERIATGWLVFNTDDHVYWRRGAAGYTGSVANAGRYALLDALRFASVRDDQAKERGYPIDVVVPSPELIASLLASWAPHTGETCVAWIEIRVATLIEAARLMCPHCKHDEQLGYHPSDPDKPLYPLTNHAAFYHWTCWDYEDRCDAYNINAELVRIWGENQ